MKWVRSLIQVWCDFLFPPLCKGCDEDSSTGLLCPSCWELCSLPDPAYRCSHCFHEVQSEGLCNVCRFEPSLFFPSAFVFEPSPPAYQLCKEGKEAPEAMAAFLFVQWERLHWPFPDVVVPLPGAKELAKVFSFWLNSSYMPVLSYCNGLWECSVEALEEDLIVLILGDKVSLDLLKEAALALNQSFPKKIYALTLLRI